MAEVGREVGLDAFDSIGRAVEHLGGVDLIHTSGTIQYTPDPLKFLDTLLALDAPVFFLARLPLWRGEQLVTIQESQLSSNGLGPLPPGIADALIRYPDTLVNLDELMRRISGRYELRIALDRKAAILGSGSIEREVGACGRTFKRIRGLALHWLGCPLPSRSAPRHWL